MFNVDQNRDMCYLCRWALQRIVVQNDALKVSEISVAYRDCRYLVTGKIEPDQWELSQLCKPNQHRNDTTHLLENITHFIQVPAFLTRRQANEVVSADVEVTKNFQLTDLWRKSLDLITADILEERERESNVHE